MRSKPFKKPTISSALKRPQPPPGTIPRKPLTTQGKMLKAQRAAEKASKNVPREAPEPSAPSTPPPTTTSLTRPAKKPKAKSFPPPHELEELARERKAKEAAAGRRLTKKKGRWDFSTNKPITTQEKLARAKAIQHAKGGTVPSAPPQEVAGSWVTRVPSLGEQQALLKWEGEGEERALKRSRYGIRVEKPKVPGTYTMLQYQDPVAVVPRGPGNDGDGVLMRATAKARMVQAGMREKVEAEADMKRNGETRLGKGLYDLPKEVRAKIWEYAVVELRCFIWPTSPTGREQPDLAMTCSTIREEVLPIYYGQNTFATMISPAMQPMPKGQVKKIEMQYTGGSTAVPLAGLAAVQKWATILDDAGWFRMIKKWAFDYVDPEANVIGRKLKVDEDDGSFVVHVEFVASEPVEDNEVMPSCPELLRMEVHREGSCILPGWKNCGRCTVQSAPAEAIRAAMELHEARRPKPANIGQLTKQFRDLMPKLQAARCVDGQGCEMF